MIYQYAINIESIQEINQISILCNALSKERKERINKFHFVKDKIRSTFAEILVRYALYDTYGLRIEDIQFDYSKYGKPFLRNQKDIYFNLSHSGDWIVCAVGDTSMGVDVEVIKNSRLPSAYNFFTQQEINLLNKTLGEKQSDLFYRLWTLKESFVKNSGLGLNYGLDNFCFEFENGSVQLIQDGKVSLDKLFVSKKIDEKHWYALCVNEGEVLSDIRIVTINDLLENECKCFKRRRHSII